MLDAALSDWNGVPYKAQTPFRPCFEDDEAPENHFEGTKNVVECSTGVEFETYGGGIWNGPHDQASAIALGWTANVLYIAVKVTDDVHVNGQTSTGTFRCFLPHQPPPFFSHMHLCLCLCLFSRAQSDPFSRILRPQAFILVISSTKLEQLLLGGTTQLLQMVALLAWCMAHGETTREMCSVLSASLQVLTSALYHGRVGALTRATTNGIGYISMECWSGRIRRIIAVEVTGLNAAQISRKGGGAAAIFATRMSLSTWDVQERCLCASPVR